jgi:hypothetical protein
MTDELKGSERRSRGSVEVLSYHLPEKPQKTPKIIRRPDVRTRTELRTY